jgi:hypothetical protein
VRWLPCRRDPPPLPAAEEKALGKRLKAALDKAADQAGIKPGGFPEDDDQEK